MSKKHKALEYSIYGALSPVLVLVLAAEIIFRSEFITYIQIYLQ